MCPINRNVLSSIESDEDIWVSGSNMIQLLRNYKFSRIFVLYNTRYATSCTYSLSLFKGEIQKPLISRKYANFVWSNNVTGDPFILLNLLEYFNIGFIHVSNWKLQTTVVFVLQIEIRSAPPNQHILELEEIYVTLFWAFIFYLQLKTYVEHVCSTWKMKNSSYFQ